MSSDSSESDWMINESGIYIDIHGKLRPFDDVLAFFQRIEREYDVKEYCNGSNSGGRWIYQIYSREFITEIADILNTFQGTVNRSGQILEVMSGDGKLSEFLKPSLEKGIFATDSKTSRDNIEFPKWVECIDAIQAVKKYKPSVVVMCWEPFYSDVSSEIIESGVPLLWIGDPSSSAVGTSLSEWKHKVIPTLFGLSRHDAFNKRVHKTVARLYNYPKQHIL